MLIHSNITISINRFVETNGEKIRSVILTGYSVYIQPRAEKVVTSIDGQGAYKEYILMTDGSFEIKIGDKINDGINNYYVDGGQIFDDITGKHGQYILMKDYE